MEIVAQLDQTRINESRQIASEGIIGSIRINPKNYTDAFINNPDGGPDIYVEGVQSRNAAMDGDIVRVKLNPQAEWKLNRIKIANRWDEWSQYLLPIIQAIENLEGDERYMTNQTKVFNDETQANNQSKTTHGSTEKDEKNLKTSKAKQTRVKRSTIGSDFNIQNKNSPSQTSSKLPSNLPAGISKLEVEHVIHLPFSSQCIQKTGFVIEVVRRNHLGVAGGFLRPHSREFAIFSPTDARVPRMLIDISQCPIDFSVQPERYKNVLFVAQITEWGGDKFATGSLVKIVGDGNQIQSRIEALLIENQIYDEEFPPDAYSELEYLKHLPQDWFSKNSLGRRDLTKECIFTIDPKTARDLDDAVSIKQIAEQIYEVGVHIADVSFFVKELSAVDYYARLRTTSVYLVDRVIPMLPRILCEQMCSLNPDEPKFTFSVIWKMDKYGRIIDQWFGRTIIRSCVKLAYEQAQDLIDKPRDISWIDEQVNMPKLYAFDWKYISKSVVLLNKIAQNLRAKRFEDGALKIEQVKLKYELDPSTGFPTGFSFENRGPANYLIEEYMLLANMSVGKRIYQHNKKHAFLRRHPPSPITQLKEVKEFCDAKGCPLDITSSGSIQKSLNAIKDSTMLKVVSFLLLRAMQNAEYVCAGDLVDDDNYFSHFALNVPFYTHFTSPIRRYADVIVHRLLSLALDYEKETNEDVDSLSSMAGECTKRKISSKLISDTSQKLYFNLFIQRAGPCELLACVTRIHDKSFDVILIDYDRSGRVYLDKLKPNLVDMKFEIFSGVKRLVLQWKPVREESSTKSKKKKKRINNREVGHAHQNMQNELGTSIISQAANNKLLINEPVDDMQVIEVFDIVRVSVTIDEKDITLLRINLKAPC